MRFGSYLMAAAAATMAVAPAMANPAASLSVTKSARAGGVAKHGSDLAGGGAIVAIVAAIAVIAGIVVVAREDNNSTSR